jgi:acetyl esterase
MPLNPQVASLLAALDALSLAPVHTLTPQQARTQYDAVVAARRGPGFVPEPVAAVEDLRVPQGPLVRLCRPTSAGPPPVLVFFHGGGWVVGGLDSHDGIARALCRRGEVAVVAVDYRLAPEHPYPAPLEDCLSAVRWVAGAAGELGLDAGRLAVGGDSAGGNLAAAVALAARDGGPRLAAQLLVYPAVDVRADAASYEENGTGYFLSAQDMRWYWQQYAGANPDASDPLLSPLAAPSFAGLPPAVVATADYDPLRDEGDELARRLQEDGVAVWHRCYPGLTHGFLGSGAVVDAADAAVDEVAAALAALLHG